MEEVLSERVLFNISTAMLRTPVLQTHGNGWQSLPLVLVQMLAIYEENIHLTFVLPDVYREPH